MLIRTRDIGHFRIVLEEKVNRLPGILQTTSFAVMETVKDIHSNIGRKG
ncbi:MAG: hypothetical protein AAF250_16615 [Pseudomonadota bacterium]